MRGALKDSDSLPPTSGQARVLIGYKMTEVGVIPADWSVDSVGGLFDILRTASNSRADLGDCGRIAYIHYGDIHTQWNHFIDFSSASVPRLITSGRLGAALLRDGDLIVADASEDEAGVGKSVEVRNLGDQPAVAGLHTMLLRSRDTRLHHGFRGYLQEVPAVKAQFRRVATGLKVFGVSKRAIKNILVPVPPPPEQRAIARALSHVDELIGALERLIAKKRAIKQATMQQLLTGKTRLPGFSGEWETKRLGDVLKFQVGFPFSSRFFTSSEVGYRLVKNRDLKADDEVVHFTGPFSEEHRVSNGDV